MRRWHSGFLAASRGVGGAVGVFLVCAGCVIGCATGTASDDGTLVAPPPAGAASSDAAGTAPTNGGNGMLGNNGSGDSGASSDSPPPSQDSAPPPSQDAAPPPPPMNPPDAAPPPPDPCAGYASPDTVAQCNACSGHTCQANGCYGGYFCNLSTGHCTSPATAGCDAGP